LYRVFRRYASFKMAKFKELAFHFRHRDVANQG